MVCLFYGMASLSAMVCLSSGLMRQVCRLLRILRFTDLRGVSQGKTLIAGLSYALSDSQPDL